MKILLLALLLLANQNSMARSYGPNWERFIKATEFVVTGRVIAANLTDPYQKINKFEDGSLKLKLLIEEILFVSDGSNKLKLETEIEVYFISEWNHFVAVGAQGTFFLKRENNKLFLSDYQFGAWPIVSIRSQNLENNGVDIIDTYDMKHINIFKMPSSMKVEVNELVELKEGNVYKQKIELNKYFTVDSVKKYFKDLELNIDKGINKNGSPGQEQAKQD